ncbi:hypothetical protein GCM10008968_19370 [Bacillus horti]
MNIKSLQVVLLLVGVISFVYGWLQSVSFPVRSEELERILLSKTVKQYVFMAAAVILWIITYCLYVIEMEVAKIKKDNV